MIERRVVNYPEYINIKGTETILEQMKKSICKINLGNGKSGTGFFCDIPYKNKQLKVLITNYHVIDENVIKNNNKINLGINDNDYINILLENDRRIYLSDDNKDDLAIIEIKDKDHLNKIKFLKLDKRLLIEGSESIYTTDNSIYITQYPHSNDASVSYGILTKIKDNTIYHKCWTEFGSSGSPIINLKTKRVLGVHKGYENQKENIGIFLKRPIIQLNNEMKRIQDIKCNYPRYIEDGIYNIIPKHCDNRAIDINNASSENMANLQLYEINNTKAQQFEVKYNYEYKYYTIKCLCSNKYLSVDYNNNYNIVQFEEKNNINQQWYIDRRDNNYIIISKMNGYSMNVDGYGLNLGTNISCQPRTDELNQQFQFKIAEIEYFKKPLYNGNPYFSENSIVDGLKLIGEDSSFDYRAKIATVNGIVNNIQDYKIENNVRENIQMLKLLKEGKLKKP